MSRLIRLRRLVNDESATEWRREHASDHLTRLQAIYTSKVEAYLIKRDRFGAAHKPQTAAELGVLLLTRVDRMAEAMEGILDVMRGRVCNPVFTRRVTTASSLIRMF